MPLVSATLANLINGVSQQPDTVRLPSQVELQENAFGTVADGLFKRPNSTHIKTLDAARIGTNTFTHFMDFGSDGRYVAVITNGAIRVFNVASGVECTVTMGTGASTYLTLQDGSSDMALGFRAVNFKDHALILNRTMATATVASGSGGRSSGIGKVNRHLISVNVGNYSSTYKIGYTKSGTARTFTKSTSATSASDIQTTQIASDLKVGLAAAAAADTDFAVYQEANTIFTRWGAAATDTTAYTFQGADSGGGKLMTIVGDTVQRFSDLPNFGTTEMQVVKVIGENASLASPYYVAFQSYGENQDLSGVSAGKLTRGAWVETRTDVGTTITGLDATKMPFKLLRTGAATFTLAQVSWGTKDVGDDTTNPAPGFAGRKVSDIFAFKNRLGMVADDTLSLSRHGDTTAFFRATTTTILDTDPINVVVSHPKMSRIRAAVPYQGALVLFTDKAQFSVPDTDLLTSRTISVSQVSEYDSASDRVRPAVTGGYLHFAFQRGSYLGVREFSGSFRNLQDFGGIAEASDISAHIPRYISGTPVMMAGSTTVDSLAVLTSDTDLYVYSYFWNGDTKLVSSWSKFVFGAAKIQGVAFFDGVLHLVIDRTADDASVGTFLESIPLNSIEADTGLDYKVLLDRRITGASCTAISYNSGAGTTQFTLPYKIPDDQEMAVVVRTTTSPYVAGQRITVQATGVNTVTVNGDFSSVPVFIGQTYEMLVQLSKQYLKTENPSGGAPVVNTSGRLQMRAMRFIVSQTGYFQVRVTPSERSTYVYEFSPRISISQIGVAPVRDDVFRVPLLAKNDQVEIVLASDSYLPCRFTSAEWTALFVSKEQKI